MSAIPSYTELTREVSRNLTPLRTHNADVMQGFGALGVVRGGQLDRITGVPEIFEVDALDHPAAVDVQARDDARCETHR